MRIGKLIDELLEIQIQQVMKNKLDTEVIIEIDKDDTIEREGIELVYLDKKDCVVLTNKEGLFDGT